MNHQLLHNRHINKHLWDACVLQSPCPDIYALSWYLDVECPHWKGLVFEDYRGVFPLPIMPKYIIFKSLKNNFLTKDLNIYAYPEFNRLKAAEVINSVISKYRFVDLSIHADVEIRPSFNASIKRKQYIDFDNYTTYPGKTLRKSIRDAEAHGYHVVHDMDSGLVADFLERELRKKHGLNHAFFFKNLKALIRESIKQGHGYVSGLYCKEELCAVDFYAVLNDRLYLIQNAGNENSKVGGMPYLLYQVIERFRTQVNIVDFMGSNIPAIVSFNKNFCNKEAQYRLVSKP